MLYIGTDPKNKKISLPEETLKKHFIALGGSGSGKTVLCKVVIEEASKLGIKSIIIDTQGDLSSLALKSEKINSTVVIYTPTSSRGIPLCMNPLKLSKMDIPEEEVISLLNSVASSVCKLMGYNTEIDSGKKAEAFLYGILSKAYHSRKEIDDFESLIALALAQEESEFLSKKEIEAFITKLKILTVGEKRLLFNFGVKLDIEELFKTSTISVIYLNTLNSQEDKDFLISIVAKELYQWMLNHPSDKLHALMYIDEISSFIPAGSRTTSSKDILMLLFKQARKYGLGCIISTQNPGDIDYKAFAQFGTWAIGRLTVKQDREKIKTSLKSLAGDSIVDVIEDLAKLKPGEFMLFSPDNFDKLQDIKVRWLLTEHKTLTVNDIEKITDPIRDRFKIDLKDAKEPVARPFHVPGVKSAELHFPINTGHSEIMALVEKKKKKLFWLFGPANEKLDSLSLKYIPFYKTIVKSKEERLKGLLKSDIKEYTVYFNALDGNIYSFDSRDFDRYTCFSHLLKVTDSELDIIKALTKKEEQTVNEIAYETSKQSQTVNNLLHSLLDKKIVTFGKHDNINVWSLLLDLDVDDYISDIDSDDIELSQEKYDASIVKPVVNIADVSRLVRSYFKTSEIISHETVYYPVWEIRYLSRKGKRTIILSAVNAKEFE